MIFFSRKNLFNFSKDCRSLQATLGRWTRDTV